MSALLRTPLFALAATLVVFQLCDALSRRMGRPLWLNPLLWATAVLVGLLKAAGLAYADYFAAARPIHLLLGPATVALAVPLYDQRRAIAERAVPLAVALLLGSTSAILSSAAFVLAVGGSRALMFSLVQKSVTTPVAMGIAEKLGGMPALASGTVLVTGLVGAATILPILNLLRRWGLPKSTQAEGFAMGMAAHGIGLARAFGTDAEMGAFAGVAMSLNAVLTAVLVPVLTGWLNL